MVNPSSSSTKSSATGGTAPLKHSATNRVKTTVQSCALQNENVRRVRPGVVRSPEKRSNFMQKRTNKLKNPA